MRDAHIPWGLSRLGVPVMQTEMFPLIKHSLKGFEGPGKLGNGEYEGPGEQSKYTKVYYH